MLLKVKVHPIASSSTFDIVSRGSGYTVTNVNNIPLKSLTGSGTGAVALLCNN